MFPMSPACAARMARKFLTALTLLTAWLALREASGAPLEFRGSQFIGLTQLSHFARDMAQAVPAPARFLSPPITPEIAWDELVVSWNVPDPAGYGIEIEVKVIFPEGESGWYHLGKWSLQGEHPRESVQGQDDADGRVETDTLKLKRPGGAARLRITLHGAATSLDRISFLGLAFHDSRAAPPPLAPNAAAWNRVLPVPEKSQLDYPDGANHWCSPTSLAMVLAYWAVRLDRPEMNHTVPAVARLVHDPHWPGTGNWPFNTAFAGAHPGLRAGVARLSDLAEIEDWIAADIPVILSVSSGLLKGGSARGNGHLIVVVGFDDKGDVIANDPGRKQVRQTYARNLVARAWADSRHTVYLIHPLSTPVPQDRFGHWHE